MPQKFRGLSKLADDTKRYGIVLKLDPTDTQTDMGMREPYKSKFLGSNEKRVKEIVQMSLHGFDLLDYKLEGDVFKGIITTNEGASVYDSWGKNNVEEVVNDIYENAPDLWMGGDIDVGNDHTELFIKLLGIKFLSAKQL